MSFKRDGDDKSLLNKLKSRRVAELFGEDIPDDEALLMKNGRYCCMVCHHRPIFDTLNMLAVHRQGKKHLAALEWIKQDKWNLELEKIKRQQGHFVKHGTHMEFEKNETSNKTFMKSGAYDPRVKKSRSKPYERKSMLDIPSSKDTSVPSTSATQLQSLAGYTKPCLLNRDDALADSVMPQTIDEYRKKKFLKEKSETIAIRPYVKKDNKFFQNYAHVITNLNTMPQVKQEESHSHSPQQETLSASMSKAEDLHNSHPLPSACTDGSDKKAKVFVHPHQNKSSKTIKSDKTNLVQYGPTVNEERQRKQEEFLRARESGWIKDWRGNWVQDENVEFDSDEEPPDV